MVSDHGDRKFAKDRVVGPLPNRQTSWLINGGDPNHVPKSWEPILQVSHEKTPPTFHYTGWLIGILIMVYYNPYITG